MEVGIRYVGNGSNMDVCTLYDVNRNELLKIRENFFKNPSNEGGHPDSSLAWVVASLAWVVASLAWVVASLA